MKNFHWLYHRLRAMSIAEIVWRLSQKSLQNRERQQHGTAMAAVTERVHNPALADLVLDSGKLGLNLNNKNDAGDQTLALLGGYDYESHKRDWHGGFQTANKWPLAFSYALNYKQRDDIGDARTNWELNRHFQFALLAKNYHASGDKAYLAELTELFADWNEKNPFLWGIAWTSVMETAIRASNWVYVYGFLENTETEELREKLRIGILNMTDYVARHYSRYSSANNHLLVEAYCLGQSGILFDHRPWLDLSLSLLVRELARQNHADGVNKEQALFYQAFGMEAFGLLGRLLYKNGREIPETWLPALTKMCRYLADCQGRHGETIEFGDSDNSKILDLTGGEWKYYPYVLSLFGPLLPERYDQEEYPQNNIAWLFSAEEIEKTRQKPLYTPPACSCYREGGVTVLRSRDQRAIIGIDHGELGFGRLAAHGHADALSFQMYLDGEPLFIDPGTYIYHIDSESRHEFRCTRNHNTACVDDRNQSEMLGAFLWGKRAKCRLRDCRTEKDGVELTAEHDGYAPEMHQRTYVFNGHDELKISDNFRTNANKEIHFILAPLWKINYDDEAKTIEITGGRKVADVRFHGDETLRIAIGKTAVSRRYGQKAETLAVTVQTKGLAVETVINWGDHGK
jgi:hypothetical protein